MKSEPINDIRRRFKKEWLLIAIDKMDEKRTVPLAGHVLAHSAHRDDVYRAMMDHQGLDLVIYSEDTLPAGYATAF